EARSRRRDARQAGERPVAVPRREGARRHRPPELAPRRVQGGIGALALRRRDRRNAATGARQANARRPLTADRSAWTSSEAHALTITVRRRVPVLLAVCVPSLVA